MCVCECLCVLFARECLMVRLLLSLFLYSQNRVMRSTLAFFGEVEGLGVGVADGRGVEGSCGMPAAAIMLVIRCCCIINIIIDAAIGLNKFGFGPGKT
jgi:hypothetical protein